MQKKFAPLLVVLLFNRTMIELKYSTVSILEIVQHEGGRSIRRKDAHYNLEMILSVGYRVKVRVWYLKIYGHNRILIHRC